jgi:hypothetical protein
MGGWRNGLRLCLAAAGPWLTGVALAGGPGAPRAQLAWQQVQVVASAQANQGAVTRLDIVLVHDVAWMPRLPVTAAQWFDQRQALQAGAGRGLKVVSLEVPPGTVLPKVKLPSGATRAAGALVYAGFAPGGGPTAAALAPHPCVQIVLDLHSLTQSACAERR